MKTVDIKELVLSGDAIDVALFVTCTRCMGVGTYEQKFIGGPYGIDRSYQENCSRCYQENGKATGTQMVKMPLSRLVEAIKASG